MGVILNRTITLHNGLIVENPYASIGNNRVTLEKVTKQKSTYDPVKGKGENKEVTEYVIKGLFDIWVNHSMRTTNMKCIDSIVIEVTSETPPTGNIYELLYTKLKSESSCTDAV
jgi:hypothetical protein